MNKRSAIFISGAMAVALLSGIVGANRAAISASRPRVVVQRATAQQQPQHGTAPTYTERE